MHSFLTPWWLCTAALLFAPFLGAQEGTLTSFVAAEDAVLLNEGVRVSFFFLPEGTPEAADTSSAPAHGTSMHHLRGERGQHEGRDLYLQVAPAGSDNPSPALGIGYDTTLSATYEIIATGEPISKHWLKPGAVLGLHHVHLKLETDQQEFEKFIRTMWAPTRSDALPDSKFIFLKGVSGARSGEFSYLWLIEDEETRDYYFPQSGEASTLYSDFEKGWSWIDDADHLGKYVDPAPGDVFTDYVVVR